MTLAVAADELGQEESSDGPLGAVHRALSKFDVELVLRVRARVQAYQAASEWALPRRDLKHVDVDFDPKDVDRVVELLVDLKELGPRVSLTESYRILPPR